MNYASGQMGASFDLGFEEDKLATQLRQQEDEKRKRAATGVGGAPDPNMAVAGASAMLMGG